MFNAPRPASANGSVIETNLFGHGLLNDPLLNKGTAFSEGERDVFELHGLLPPNVATLDEQVGRRLKAFRDQPSDLARYVFLRGLQDSNEVLFYALLANNLSEALPVIYTPTVGLGCQEFSRLFRKPRGLFLSMTHRDRIKDILANRRFDDVEVIVVTDGERILGLGDQGAGGMGIPIGKLSLYTACAGFHPARTLPIMLDVGTDNPECLSDPLYIGWREKRVRGQAYDDFIEAFVTTVMERWPHVLLQWEDFAIGNATRLLDRYRNRLCTFNDDIQGTAAVATAAILSAAGVTGVALKDQRIAVLGAGSAGLGISSLLLRAMMAEGLTEREGKQRFFLVDRDGLLVEGMPGLQPFQKAFAQPRSTVADWRLGSPDRIDLLDVVRNARPTVLIGVSGQPGGFPEAVVRSMAEFVERPIIFPLSNPTSRSEAAPQDLLDWSNGRAIVGTGSPFPPTRHNGTSRQVDQTNNAYIFPGLGLGTVAMKASRISEGMLLAAAQALADLSPARSDMTKNLFPPVSDLREISYRVALAVASQAQQEGLAQATSRNATEALIQDKIWAPTYSAFKRLR